MVKKFISTAAARLGALCLVIGGHSSPAISAEQGSDVEPTVECKAAIENRESCFIWVDRARAATHPAVRIDPDVGSVLIKTEKSPLEVVSFEESAAVFTEPDVVASLLKSVRDSLVAIPFKVVVSGNAPMVAPPDGTSSQFRLRATGGGDVAELLRRAVAALKSYDDDATAEAKQLEKPVAALKGLTDIKPTSNSPTLGSQTSIDWDEYRRAACSFVESVKETTACGPARGSDLIPLGIGRLSVIHQYIEAARELLTASPLPPLADAESFGSLIAAISNDYQSSLTKGEKVTETAKALLSAATLVEKSIVAGPAGLIAKQPVNQVRSATSTIKATATNQVTKAAIALPVTTIRWQHVSWEFSAGMWISGLDKRSFKVRPVLADDGAPASPAQTVLTESSSSKSTAPGFFVHKTALEWQLGAKRIALMPTAGIGVRDGSAEFVVGGSIAWGDLYGSIVRHKGRDVKLTNGLQVGQVNPPAIDGFQKKYGVWNWAVVLSYRVPIP